jgi:hypothetical protein
MAPKAIKHPLLVIIILGSIVRVWYTLSNLSIHHPDEIFQTLEPAYRLITGSGLIPWDYAYGLRSYVIPFVLSVPLRLFTFINADPSFYVPAISLTLALLSSLLIAAVYATTRFFSTKQTALIAAFLAAFWPELIYFSPRALTETFAILSYSLVAIFLFRPKPRLFLTGFFTLTALLLRIQWFPLFIAVGYYLYRNSKISHSRLILGSAASLALFGLVDFFTYGFPFIHQYQNLRLSWLSGISAQFGTQPWWYYLFTLTSLSGILLLPLLKFHPKQNLKPLILTGLGILIIHSLLPHKEYRFLLILIPLIIITTAPAWTIIYQRSKALFIILCISVFAAFITNNLPNQLIILGTPFITRDQGLTLTATHSRCGVYYPDRDWVYTGGNYMLGSTTPLFDHLYPPPTESNIDILVMPSNISLESNTFLPLSTTPAYQIVGPSSALTTHPGYTVYQQDHCTRDPNYTPYRSFDYLEPILNQFTPYL